MQEIIALAYVALASTLVPVIRGRGHYGWTEFKDRAFVLLSAAAFVVLLPFLPAVGGRGAASFLGLFVAYLTASTFWSDDPRGALEDLTRWWGLLLFALCCGVAPMELSLRAVFLPAPFVAVYGLIHQWLVMDPIHPETAEFLRKRKKATRLYSWLGNSNYTAAYLAPNFFIGFHLALTSSPWWFLALVPVTAAIVWSQCRAAWCSVVVGLAVLDAILYPELIALGITLFLALALICLPRIAPTIGRIFYALACFHMWRGRPLFGWGPRVFRRKYFRVQAQMNRKDPTILGDLENEGRNTFPVGKRAHNDHAETLAEGGVIGYGLLLAFMGVSVYAALPHPVLTAGLVAAWVHALFFYNLRTAATAIPAFGLAGAAAMGPGVVAVPLAPAVLLAAVAAWIAYRHAWRPLVAGEHYARACDNNQGEEAERHLQRALQLDPYNNMFLTAAAFPRDGWNPAQAFIYLERAIQHIDGQKLEWALFDQFGRTAWMNGAMLVAKRAFEQAVFLNPSYQPAYEGLQKTVATIPQAQQDHEARHGNQAQPQR